MVRIFSQDRITAVFASQHPLDGPIELCTHCISFSTLSSAAVTRSTEFSFSRVARTYVCLRIWSSRKVPPSASGEGRWQNRAASEVLDSERRGGHNHDRGPRSAVCNSDLGGSFLITTTTRSGILFLLHAVALAHHFQVIMSDDKPLKRVVIRANRVQTEILKAAYTQSQTASGEQLEILFEQTGLHVLLNCSWLLLIVYPYL